MGGLVGGGGTPGLSKTPGSVWWLKSREQIAPSCGFHHPFPLPEAERGSAVKAGRMRHRRRTGVGGMELETEQNK